MDPLNMKPRDFSQKPHPIEQLQDVMDDMEAFLANWLTRVEQLQTASAMPDAQLRRRFRELEQEKIQWEAKRNRETQDLHEKAEQLVDAWLRLEAEQRRLTQIRDAHGQPSRNVTTETSESKVTPEADTEQVAPVQEMPQEVAVHKVPAPAAPRRPSPTLCQPACSSAIQQFQQLRREIETSRQVHSQA